MLNSSCTTKMQGWESLLQCGLPACSTSIPGQDLKQKHGSWFKEPGDRAVGRGVAGWKEEDFGQKNMYH